MLLTRKTSKREKISFLTAFKRNIPNGKKTPEPRFGSLHLAKAIICLLMGMSNHGLTH